MLANISYFVYAIKIQLSVYLISIIVMPTTMLLQTSSENLLKVRLDIFKLPTFDNRSKVVFEYCLVDTICAPCTLSSLRQNYFPM